MPLPDERPSPAPASTAAAEPVEELSPDDDAWLGNEPSASLELSWIEDDLQNTPVDELTSPDSGPVPAAPEMKLTPPPATRRPFSPIRRPVVERMRPRAELVAEARTTPRPSPKLNRAPIVVVKAAPDAGAAASSFRRRVALLYAGAVLSGVASGVAVLLLGQ